MARATKKAAKKLGKNKTRKSPKKNRLTSNRSQDTTSVLHGPMQDAIREAFLKRP